MDICIDSSAGGDPMAIASPISSCSSTWIHSPLMKEPRPLTAVKSSLRCGSLMTATMTSPRDVAAIEGKQRGIPCTKLVVPSIGSTIHSHDSSVAESLASRADALASFLGGTSSSPKKS